jgi:hypothetical protein
MKAYVVYNALNHDLLLAKPENGEILLLPYDVAPGPFTEATVQEFCLLLYIAFITQSPRIAGADGNTLYKLDIGEVERFFARKHELSSFIVI